MKECPKCHGKYEDNIKKCPACKLPLHDYASKARYCKKCGNEIPEDAIVCPHCKDDKADKDKGILAGITLKDGDEIDQEYQKQFPTCSICGRRLKDDWEKERGKCFDCSLSEPAFPTAKNSAGNRDSSGNTEFKPTSGAWLRRASNRYQWLTVMIYIFGALIAFLYIANTGFNFTYENIIICIVIVDISVVAAMGYSAVGAHLRGMADIIDALEHIISNDR